MDQDQDELSPGQRRVLVGFTLLLPFLLLGLLEVGLRVVGVGGSWPLFVAADSSGGWLRMNPRVSERYFFGDIEAPGATFDPFRAVKRPDTYRVIVQGGSTALGFPFFHGPAFPRMLEARLERELPGRDLEVINTALTAVNSHTLLDLADEIVDAEPDVVLIYAGHNEYYGAFGVASTLAGNSPALVELYLDLRGLRLVQLLGAVWHRLRKPIAGGAVRRERPSGTGGVIAPRSGLTTMARMVGEQRIPLGSELFRRGEDQFRRNLHRVLETYEEAGIPVFIGTLVSNERDQPPFVSGADPRVPTVVWDSALDAAGQELATGSPDSARDLVWRAVGEDSANAAGFFAAARLFEEHGALDAAAELYRAARDRDQLRFRAPASFAEVIRAEAEEHGATVVEVEEAFRAASPGGIVGGQLITEHLHPWIDGYFLMADAFHDALRAGTVGGGGDVLDAAEARRLTPVTPVDSLYGAYLVESLTAGWPFQDDPAVESAVVEELARRAGTTREEELALALYRRQVTWSRAHEELLVHYDTLGRAEEATAVARALAAEHRISHRALARAGALELGLGDREAALRWFRRAVEVAPAGDPTGPAILRAVERLPQLEDRASRAPGDASALFDLAAAYALVNQRDTATAVLRTLLRTSPGHADGHRLLDMLGGAGGLEEGG